jgi:hypothetical protein
MYKNIFSQTIWWTDKKVRIVAAPFDFINLFLDFQALWVIELGGMD